jgi:ferritin-like metal-binding protein YciE
VKDFNKLFETELCKLYSAEQQIAEVLPEVVTNVNSEKLKNVLNEQVEETKQQMIRLENIAREMNVNVSQGKCPAMKALLNELSEIDQTDYEPTTKDAALIGTIQAIQHYKIACYGLLKAFARNLKSKNVEKILDESSKEVSRADNRLTEIAEGRFFASGVNAAALKKAA